MDDRKGVQSVNKSRTSSLQVSSLRDLRGPGLTEVMWK